CPGQACIGFSMASERFMRDNPAAALQALLRALPGYGARLIFPRQDSEASQLAALEGPESESRLHSITTSVAIKGNFESYWSTRHSEVRRTVRRSEKKLVDSGLTPRLRTLESPGDMADGIAEHGRLETAGWKGHEGTAIAANNRQGKMYVDLMTRFASNHDAVIYQLLLDDRVVASLLSVVHGNIQAMLKTTYDESYSALGIGRYINYLMYRDVFDRSPGRTIENYTSSTKIDRRWCTHHREIIDLDYVPLASFRALRAFKHRFKRRGEH
ncbi:MAG TPA: GNAT family N-acetyltransferase, partial [Woeseiaceae bacterium]|nr:GNAT family N-acetyltransferase [Woeseiaceae bacterium]